MDHSGMHPRTSRVSIITPYGVVVSQENCNLIEADLIAANKRITDQDDLLDADLTQIAELKVHEQVMFDIHEALGVAFGEDVYAKIDKLQRMAEVLELLCELKVAKEQIEAAGADGAVEELKTAYHNNKALAWRTAFELVYDLSICNDCGGTGLGEERMNGNEVEQGECLTCEGTGAIGGIPGEFEVVGGVRGENQEAGDSAQSSDKAAQVDPPI